MTYNRVVEELFSAEDSQGNEKKVYFGLYGTQPCYFACQVA
jgi:hypothetical protein